MEQPLIGDEKGNGKEKEQSSHIPIWRMITFASSYTSVQVVFAVMFALSTPLFMTLGLSASASIAIWFLGPVAGLLQPYIGALSDKTTLSWGRRRPFITFGCIFAILGLLLLFFVQTFTRAFTNTLAIILAVLAMLLLNVAINITMQPSRTILFDLVPADQQTAGNNAIAIMVGFGSFLTNLMVYLGYGDPFVLSIGLVIIFMIPTLMFAKEKAWTKEELSSVGNAAAEAEAEAQVDADADAGSGPSGEARQAGGRKKGRGTLAAVWFGLRNLPRPVMRVIPAFFLSWTMFFPFSISGTAYVGINIYGGREDPGPGHDLYLQGVRVGALAMGVMSLVTVVFSFFSTGLCHKFGERTVYFCVQVLSTASLIGLLFIKTPAEGWAACLLFGGIGFTMSVFNAVPFAVMGRNVAPHETGVYAGLLNIFIVAAQMIGTGLNVLALTLFKGNLQASMALGAVLSLFAMFATLVMRNEDDPAYANKGVRLLVEEEGTYVDAVPIQDHDEDSRV